MRKFAIVITILTMLIIALFMLASPTNAQEPTPTPETSQIFELDEGQHVKIDYTVTLGEFALLIGLLFIGTPMFAYFQFKIITTYLKPQ